MSRKQTDPNSALVFMEDYLYYVSLLERYPFVACNVRKGGFCDLFDFFPFDFKVFGPLPVEAKEKVGHIEASDLLGFRDS